MTSRSSKSPAVSRRAILTMPGALATPSSGFAYPSLHPFDSWAMERRLLEYALSDAPEETHARARERILDRLFALERLILETECLDLAAVRVKADLVLWTMQMEEADTLSAMRHIHRFLHRE